jgi:choice-of-anchor B domain-containing protein
MVLTSWARAVSGAIALALVAGCSDSGDPDLGEATCDESSAGFACDHVYLLSHLSLTDLGAGEGTHLNDIWGWTDPETRREYALVGRTDGTAFVNVTDPANAVYLGVLPMHAGATPGVWRDIKVYRDHAFIVADGSGDHGVQVFDLTALRQASGAPVEYSESAHYDGLASAHNIAINEASGFAYVVGANGGGETCSGGLHMLDIRDPRHPVFAGCYADSTTGRFLTGYVHDTQCVNYAGPDARFRGREICFTASESAIGIVDVTDKAHPVSLATASYPNTAYAHQGWLSEDQAYFYLDDELDELGKTASRTRTLVWDMRMLDEPLMITEHLGTTSASDHNQFVRDQYLYQSNYSSGLRVLNIADPAHPAEVGFFDTVPGDDEPGFRGAWSNYPYFPSGTIVVSSIGEGLFVLRFSPAGVTQ